MNREEILNALLCTIDETGLWMLATLRVANKPVAKSYLRDITNKRYIETKIQPEEKKLIPSRYSLDITTAKLEGAALIEVDRVGQTRFYKLTTLGNEVIKFREMMRNGVN
ncbi:cell division protein FtsZ [Paenibacillus xylanilyticus]|uniref:Cell division protein FtsZ n=1 Tax=Paenibacillus xylanilyticus TaxID=248903 RepID=A0A7Y6BTI0_9BACL|nr:cell division protein FtsZ [Paenibacillus xylanilyticus]NUU74672.1 cell division protein FtsZ [Paenibacillus xylanilyticus]